jgi:GxxExxY protein
MPIHRPRIRDLTQAEFDAIDRLVMECAYASQNELGRLCDERVYESDLALRLSAIGADVYRQLPIVVTHGTFQKTYRLDLVWNHAVYDAKSVASFTGVHESQALNYAMLLDVRHVKLINFRTPRVQGRLCFNGLSEGRRRVYHIQRNEWRELSPRCGELMSILTGLLQDWGAFLETQLYEEALVHFLGGEDACRKRIELQRNGHPLGTHRVSMHSPEHFFVVTAMSHETGPYRQQLKRLLRLTDLSGLQWINLNHHDIELVTIR